MNSKLIKFVNAFIQIKLTLNVFTHFVSLTCMINTIINFFFYEILFKKSLSGIVSIKNIKSVYHW